MDLQEHRGISHQQLPVVDMLLFGCDLFFFPRSVSQGKNKQARDSEHSRGYHLGASLADVFASGPRSGQGLCRQTIGYHSFVSRFSHVLQRAIPGDVCYIVWRKFQSRKSLH